MFYRVGLLAIAVMFLIKPTFSTIFGIAVRRKVNHVLREKGLFTTHVP